MSETPAGWYSDPKGAFLYRYWDGAQWSTQVSNGGANSGVDPDPLPPAMIATPPAPGTAAPSTTAAPQPTVQVTQSGGSGFGTVIAIVLAVAAIVVVIALLVNSGDDSGSSGTDAPPDTPATTQPAEPPAEE